MLKRNVLSMFLCMAVLLTCVFGIITPQEIVYAETIDGVTSYWSNDFDICETGVAYLRKPGETNINNVALVQPGAGSSILIAGGSSTDIQFSVEENVPGADGKAMYFYENAAEDNSNYGYYLSIGETNINAKKYLVYKTRIKNGASDAQPGFGALRYADSTFRIGMSKIYDKTWGNPADLKQYDWNDIWFVTDTTAATTPTSVVINGVWYPNLKGNAPGTNLYIRHVKYEGASTNQNLWVDSIDLFGVDDEINTLTYNEILPTTVSDTLTLSNFSNPLPALNANSFTINNGAAISAISAENGTYELSFTGLVAGETYTVSFEDGVTDVFGNTLSVDFTIADLSNGRVGYWSNDFDICETGIAYQRKPGETNINNVALVQPGAGSNIVIAGGSSTDIQFSVEENVPGAEGKAMYFYENAAHASNYGYYPSYGETNIKANKYLVYKTRIKNGASDSQPGFGALRYADSTFRIGISKIWDKNWGNPADLKTYDWNDVWFVTDTTASTTPTSVVINGVWYPDLKGNAPGQNLYIRYLASDYSATTNRHLWVDSIELFGIDDTKNNLTYTSNASSITTSDGILTMSDFSNPMPMLSPEDFVVTGAGTPVVKAVGLENGVYSLSFSGLVGGESYTVAFADGVTDVFGNIPASVSFSIMADGVVSINEVSDDDNGVVTASISNTGNARENSMLFCAYYDDSDRIVDVKKQNTTIRNGVGTYTFEKTDEAYDSVRVFAWDKDLKPYCESR